MMIKDTGLDDTHPHQTSWHTHAHLCSSVLSACKAVTLAPNSCSCCSVCCLIARGVCSDDRTVLLLPAEFTLHVYPRLLQ